MEAKENQLTIKIPIRSCASIGFLLGRLFESFNENLGHPCTINQRTYLFLLPSFEVQGKFIQLP
ncbi:MAG: hypothetical protein ACYCOO_00960 [Chitinophagaceae bacterium]